MKEITTRDEFNELYIKEDIYLQNNISKKVFYVIRYIRDCNNKDSIYTLFDGVNKYNVTFTLIKNKYTFFDGDIKEAEQMINNYAITHTIKIDNYIEIYNEDMMI